MNTYLQEAIEEFEKERASLEKSIAEYLEEEDYKYAAFHQKALWKVRAKLDILYEIRTPHYPKIAANNQAKHYYDKLRKDQSQSLWLSKAVIGSLERRLKDEEEEIRRLNDALQFQEIKYDKQDIDDALFKLVEQSITGFRLYFTKDELLYLDFRLSKSKEELEIAFPPGAHEPDDHHFGSIRNPGPINNLGFKVEETNELVYRYGINKFKDALDIKIVLARISYDFLFTSKQHSDFRLVFN